MGKGEGVSLIPREGGGLGRGEVEGGEGGGC